MDYQITILDRLLAIIMNRVMELAIDGLQKTVVLSKFDLSIDDSKIFLHKGLGYHPV